MERQLEEMAASRNVNIRVGTPLPELWADPARVELALINLVSNGIKYSDPKKTDRFVEIAPATADDGGSCAFCVRDNGLGIPEADRSSIFDKFFRGHAQLDAQLGIDGSGLGLAISRAVVEAHGGTIWIEDSRTGGAIFFVLLPRATEESESLSRAS